MPEHGEEELEDFSELLPNRNSFRDPRLATTEEPMPSIDERARMDREMLLKIREITPRLRGAAARQAALDVERRLQGFLADSRTSEDSNR